MYIVALVFAFAGLIDAALPVFVKDTLHAGPVVLSVMLAAWGVGSVAGMLVVRRRQQALQACRWARR